MAPAWPGEAAIPRQEPGPSTQGAPVVVAQPGTLWFNLPGCSMAGVMSDAGAKLGHAESPHSQAMSMLKPDQVT